MDAGVYSFHDTQMDGFFERRAGNFFRVGSELLMKKSSERTDACGMTMAIYWHQSAGREASGSPRGLGDAPKQQKNSKTDGVARTETRFHPVRRSVGKNE